MEQVSFQLRSKAGKWDSISQISWHQVPDTREHNCKWVLIKSFDTGFVNFEFEVFFIWDMHKTRRLIVSK